ncbi:MAG: beta-lactamase family protein, partial [Methylococcales bacterium]|nr:beta-lactamase family protein [Methylococcales bacterium]
MKIQLILFATLFLQIRISLAQETALNDFLPNPKAAKLNQPALKNLNAAMQKQISNDQVSGVIGLIANHNRVGYYETFGFRSIEKKQALTTDTVYRIFSMTKPIVTATAMSLWEDGKFKLDDPISKHCPEWKNISVRVDGKVVPATKAVTPRQLMTHSSGMNYDDEGLKMEPSTT